MIPERVEQYVAYLDLGLTMSQHPTGTVILKHPDGKEMVIHQQDLLSANARTVSIFSRIKEWAEK